MAGILKITDRLPLPKPVLGSASRTETPIRTIPRLGFGVYQSPPDKTYRSCLEALRAGYRQIDSAQYYANEAEVGQAVRDSDVLLDDEKESGSDNTPSKDEQKTEGMAATATERQRQRRRRSKVFLTTKILGATGDVDKTYDKCVASVEKMDPGEDGYVDLFLIHSPNCGKEKRKELWWALERLYESGKAKSIGVSNYGAPQIEEMKEYANVVWPPQVNQIELHPFCQQRNAVAYCHKNNIVIQAYSPIVRNYKAHDPTLLSIAANHQKQYHHRNPYRGNKSVAQILIRYCLQKGWVPLPKSDDPARIRENANLFDVVIDDKDGKEIAEFVLSEKEMGILDSLDPGDGKGAVVQAVEGDN